MVYCLNSFVVFSMSDFCFDCLSYFNFFDYLTDFLLELFPLFEENLGRSLEQHLFRWFEYDRLLL